MDEVNVFLYGIILLGRRAADHGRQRAARNASLLRWVSIVGGGIIVLVVGGVVVTV